VSFRQRLLDHTCDRTSRLRRWRAGSLRRGLRDSTRSRFAASKHWILQLALDQLPHFSDGVKPAGADTSRAYDGQSPRETRTSSVFIHARRSEHARANVRMSASSRQTLIGAIFAEGSVQDGKITSTLIRGRRRAADRHVWNGASPAPLGRLGGTTTTRRCRRPLRSRLRIARSGVCVARAPSPRLFAF